MISFASLVQSGVNVFGLFNIDPALLTFLLVAVLFGGLNLIEYKKFW